MWLSEWLHQAPFLTVLYRCTHALLSFGQTEHKKDLEMITKQLFFVLFCHVLSMHMWAALREKCMHELKEVKAAIIKVVQYHCTKLGKNKWNNRGFLTPWFYFINKTRSVETPKSWKKFLINICMFGVKWTNEYKTFWNSFVSQRLDPIEFWSLQPASYKRWSNTNCCCMLACTYFQMSVVAIKTLVTRCQCWISKTVRVSVHLETTEGTFAVGIGMSEFGECKFGSSLQGPHKIQEGLVKFILI